jgi:hypothetical protein
MLCVSVCVFILDIFSSFLIVFPIFSHRFLLIFDFYLNFILPMFFHYVCINFIYVFLFKIFNPNFFK